MAELRWQIKSESDTDIVWAEYHGGIETGNFRYEAKTDVPLSIKAAWSDRRRHVVRWSLVVAATTAVAVEVMHQTLASL